jgi:PAS domain-containing protein
MALSENDVSFGPHDAIQQLEIEAHSWAFDSPLMEGVDSWTCGIIIANKQGELTFANRRALELHGHVVLGTKAVDYSAFHGLFTEQGSPYPSEDLPLAVAVKARPTLRHAKWLIRRPDASRVLVIGDAFPLTTNDGQPVGGILIFRQIV